MSLTTAPLKVKITREDGASGERVGRPWRCTRRPRCRTVMLVIFGRACVAAKLKVYTSSVQSNLLDARSNLLLAF